MTNLKQRIVQTLADDTVTAASLAELVVEIETAIAAAAEAATVSREQSVDPALCPDPKAAEITRGRLLTMLPRIQQRYHDVDSAETAAEWRIDFAARAEERNALANELRDVYPRLASQLADLFAKIAANDAALSRLHQDRPSSAKGFLLGAELTALGLDEFSRDRKSIAKTLCLPDFKSNKLLWPPRSTPVAVVLAAMQSPAFDPRYSADWHRALAADTERRKAEEARGIKNEERLQEESKRAYEHSLPR